MGILGRLFSPYGASESEVVEVEEAVGPLPRAYRRFLRRLGRDENGPLRGTDCFVRHVVDNTAALPELLAENNAADILPSRYLCFFMHQGYIAAWFDLDTPDDDPACWVFHETECVVPKIDGTFTSFMRSQYQAFGGAWPAI